MPILQVTIGASSTALSATDKWASQVIVQNNAAHTMRVGDSTVSSTTGILLASGSPGGSVNLGPHRESRLNLKDVFVNGTQNDVVDILYYS